jgi:hypothetical protein
VDANAIAQFTKHDFAFCSRASIEAQTKRALHPFKGLLRLAMKEEWHRLKVDRHFSPPFTPRY